MIVPRKGVIELMRMLDGGDNPLRVQIGSNNIRAHVGDFIFTSKLADGRSRMIAAFCRRTRTNIWKPAAISAQQAFARAAILGNEKFRGVRLYAR